LLPARYVVHGDLCRGITRLMMAPELRSPSNFAGRIRPEFYTIIKLQSFDQYLHHQHRLFWRPLMISSTLHPTATMA
jgi:hypothetical protein